MKFLKFKSKRIKVLDFSWLSFKSPWYSRTFITDGNPRWQRSTGKSGTVSLAQHASVILTTLKPPTGTWRTVLWLRAGVANEVRVCVEVVGTRGADTHRGGEGGLGRGSQGSHGNYTSQSLWSVARLTSSDYTASAKEAEMAAGRQVVVGRKD